MYYVHLTHSNASRAFDRLNKDVIDVIDYQNPDKTKFIVFGSKVQHARLDHFFLNLNMLRNLLKLSGIVRKLGVWFDSDFKHVPGLCKKSYFVRV